MGHSEFLISNRCERESVTGPEGPCEDPDSGRSSVDRFTLLNAVASLRTLRRAHQKAKSPHLRLCAKARR
jgi:hypothetical protein